MVYLLSPLSRTPPTHFQPVNLILDLVFMGPLRSAGTTSLGPDFMCSLSSRWIVVGSGCTDTIAGGAIGLTSLATILLGDIWAS